MESLLHFFNVCPPDIGAKLHRRHFSPGEAILTPGFRGEQIYILISGQAKLVAQRENGNAVILSLYNHWEILGELEAFTDGVCDRFIVALLPCDVYMLDKESFFEWLRLDFDFNRYILARLSYKLQRLSATSQVSMGGFLREQVAHILLMNLTDQQYFPYSKQVLAECMGTSVRSLNRILAKMIESGVISVSGSRIFIKNIQMLHAYIEEG